MTCIAGLYSHCSMFSLCYKLWSCRNLNATCFHYAPTQVNVCTVYGSACCCWIEAANISFSLLRHLYIYKECVAFDLNIQHVSSASSSLSIKTTEDVVWRHREEVWDHGSCCLLPELFLSLNLLASLGSLRIYWESCGDRMCRKQQSVIMTHYEWQIITVEGRNNLECAFTSSYVICSRSYSREHEWSRYDAVKLKRK